MEPQSTSDPAATVPVDAAPTWTRWALIVLGNLTVIGIGVRLQFPRNPATIPLPLDWLALIGVPVCLALGLSRVERLLRSGDVSRSHRWEAQVFLCGASAWLLGLSTFWRQPGLFYFASLGTLILITLTLFAPRPRSHDVPQPVSVFRGKPSELDSQSDA